MAALRYTLGQLWKAGDGKNKILPVLQESSSPSWWYDGWTIFNLSGRTT